MESSGFFASIGGDRKYDQSHFEGFFSEIVSSGIRSPADFEVTYGTGMSVDISPGWAWIEGSWYNNTGTVNLEIQESNAVSTRYDRVVIRRSASSREISLNILTGTPGGGIPPITRDASVWELSIASIIIPAGSNAIIPSQITDERLDTSVCGIAKSLLASADTQTGRWTPFIIINAPFYFFVLQNGTYTVSRNHVTCSGTVIFFINYPGPGSSTFYGLSAAELPFTPNQSLPISGEWKYRSAISGLGPSYSQSGVFTGIDTQRNAISMNINNNQVDWNRPSSIQSLDFSLDYYM